eukprot:91458_1
MAHSDNKQDEKVNAPEEYTLQSDEVSLDQTVVTVQDVGKKQFSSSYTKDGFAKTPGTLIASQFVMNDEGTKLVAIVFDVSVPAKDDKGELDPTNSYRATAVCHSSLHIHNHTLYIRTITYITQHIGPQTRKLNKTRPLIYFVV